MCLLTMESLPHMSESYYTSTFRTFKHSLRNDNRLDFLSTMKSKLVPLLPAPSQPLRILSVGAGTGEYDLLLLHEIFLPRTELIHYDALEPLEEHISMFAKKLEREPVKGVHLHQTTFENFKPRAACQYDLVLFIHSLYYLPLDSVAKSVDSYLSTNSGTVVVLMDSASGHAALHRALGLAEGPHTKCLHDVLGSVRNNLKLTSLEVLYMPQWMDVEDCFTDDSQIGVDLLSFAIYRDLRKTRKEIVEQIRSQAKNHLTIQKLGGRRHWWSPEGIALIHKAASNDRNAKNCP